MIEYQMGRVVGRFLTMVQGFPGDGESPEFVPVPSLRVTFRAALAPDRIKVLQSTDPTSLLLQGVVCATDDDGYLVDGAGNRYQTLPVTFDPDTGVSEWMWEATVSSYPGSVAPIRFLLREYRADADVVDLTTVVSVPTQPGRELAAWESAVLRTQATIARVQEAGAAAVADIEDAAGGVEQRAVEAATEAAAGYTAEAAAHAATAAAAKDEATTARGQAVIAKDDAQQAAQSAIAEADRAEAAADSVDMAAINLRLDGMDTSIGKKANLVSGKVPLAELPVSTSATPSTVVQRDASGGVTVSAVARTAQHAREHSKAAPQSVPNATWTKITFPTQEYSSGGITHAAGSFTVPIAGRYLVTAQFPWQAQAAPAGQRVAQIRRKRGSVETPVVQSDQRSASTAYATILAMARSIFCEAGDVIEVWGYHSQGSGTSQDAGSAQPEQSFITIDHLI